MYKINKRAKNETYHFYMALNFATPVDRIAGSFLFFIWGLLSD
jgi:hypothetical protein